MTPTDVPPPDPKVPALTVLLGSESQGLLAALAGASGAELRGHTVSQVRYVPGRSVTVQYRADVRSAGGDRGRSMFVATAGVPVPDGTPTFESDGVEVAVWRFPNDPLLPGLAPAVDPGRTAQLLADLGGAADAVRTRTRAYRAMRRAVVEVTSSSERVFLKVVRPDRVAALHAVHRAIASHVPVPHSFGWSEDLGIVALQAMRGRPMRDALQSGARRLPSPTALVGLLDRLPQTGPTDVLAGPAARAPDHARLLKAILPDLAGRIDRIVEAVAAVDPEDPVPVHGDFHASQLLIDGEEIVGLVDVDTAGRGSRSDDLAVLLGHLATVALGSSRRKRMEQYGAVLIREFDRRVDPAALRRRVAAVVVGLATGPFRVQAPRWATETGQRLALAERWLASAAKLPD